MSLTTTDYRCQDIDAPSFIVREDEVENLFLGILHHLLTCNMAVGICSTRKQQTKVVVHLCHRSHRTAWILVGCLLFDADDRTQPRNLINLWTLHTSQEVTHIG